MRYLLLTAALLGAAGASAQEVALDLACNFTTECYDIEPCQDTDFDSDFATLDDGFLMSSIAGERLFRLLGQDEASAAYVSEPTLGTVALLTLLPNGTAILSEHALFMPAYRVSLHGVCEARP